VGDKNAPTSEEKEQKEKEENFKEPSPRIQYMQRIVVARKSRKGSHSDDFAGESPGSSRNLPDPKASRSMPRKQQREGDETTTTEA